MSDLKIGDTVYCFYGPHVNKHTIKAIRTIETDRGKREEYFLTYQLGVIGQPPSIEGVRSYKREELFTDKSAVLEQVTQDLFQQINQAQKRISEM